jgi:SsrA-binding protein
MSPKPRTGGSDGTIASNRAAYHNYFVLETIEAGMANVHISPYEGGNVRNHEPDRERKLLLHKAEIVAMATKAKQKGLTMVPLRIYWSKNRAKLEIGLAKGKRQYDKREAIAAQDARREMDRARKTRV